MGILRRRDGRTLMEVVLGLGIMGILTVSLLSFLSFFYRTEMALSAAPANRRLLTAAASFIETQVKEEAFAGAELTAATDSAFRIEVPPGEGGGGGDPHETLIGRMELRFENGRLTLQKTGNFETLPDPIDLLLDLLGRFPIVITRFDMVYKDSQGEELDPPVNLGAVRFIEVVVEGNIGFIHWSIQLVCDVNGSLEVVGRIHGWPGELFRFVFHFDGSLVAAELNWFRIEGQSSDGGDRRPRYVEVRYENGTVTLVRKDGDVEIVAHPVPQDVVVTDFSVTYKDAQGRVLEPPLDLSRVRTVSFEIHGYHRQDPARTWVSRGTLPILQTGGSEAH
ncbi:MAG TPA: hypothetical protein GX510_09780 [Firmicutes bacterium]|nr:hypothetical protein [Candidatus Fermentithermobacillaceae bacterium]